VEIETKMEVINSKGLYVVGYMEADSTWVNVMLYQEKEELEEKIRSHNKQIENASCEVNWMEERLQELSKIITYYMMDNSTKKVIAKFKNIEAALAFTPPSTIEDGESFIEDDRYYIHTGPNYGEMLFSFCDNKWHDYRTI
jgi:molecular chaperone GrpE (heat shock protein)